MRPKSNLLCAKSAAPIRLNFGGDNQRKSTTANTSIKPSMPSVEKEPTESVTFETKATSPIVDWNSLSKESELISFKVKTSFLQKQIDDLNFKNSKLRIDNELEETKLRNTIDECRKKVETLTKEISSVKENESKLKTEIEEYKNLNSEQNTFFESQKEEYEKSVNQLKSELCEIYSKEKNLQCEFNSEKLNSLHRVEELENELSKAKDEMNVYKKHVDELYDKDSIIESWFLKNQIKEANAQIEQLNDELASYKEGSRLKEILNDDLTQLKQLQDENRQFKIQLDLLSEVRNENLILKEKVLGLENEVENLNACLTQKNIDAGQLEFMRNRFDEWTRIVGVDSPDIVVNQISELKQNISILRVENESLKSEVKMSKEKSFNDDFSAKSVELELNEAKKKNAELTDLIKKLNRKCLLFAKEKESYRKLINSYESEITMTDGHMQARVADLEGIIEDYKSLIEQQEQDLKKASANITEIASKDKEIEELKNEIGRIKSLNPSIYTNMSLCDVSTLQTNEKGYRVIHLIENPLSIKIQERIAHHKMLEEENSRLRCMVDIMGSSSGSTAQKCEECIQQRLELERVQEKLKRALQEKNSLNETFKNVSRSFRQVSQLLTGYKIENQQKNRYRLQHVWDKTAELIFEVNNKSVQLLENKTTEQLQEKIQTYLTEHDSFPAFLAAYTLELFHRQTIL